MDSSPFVVRYLSFGDQDYANEAIPQTVLDQLLKQVRAGSLSSFLLSMDEYGEDDGDFLSGDIERGWVALAFNTWDEEGEAHMYQPINQACSDSGETAPVDIGGQTPVLKRNALDDLHLAAECVLHFAKTGAMYPGLRWEEFE